MGDNGVVVAELGQGPPKVVGDVKAPQLGFQVIRQARKDADGDEAHGAHTYLTEIDVRSCAWRRPSPRGRRLQGVGQGVQRVAGVTPRTSAARATERLSGSMISCLMKPPGWAGRRNWRVLGLERGLRLFDREVGKGHGGIRLEDLGVF
jgi:hypothetical protein